MTSPEGYLLSYFDISSAEVRSIAYISKDPVLVGLFESQTDVYVYIGKKALPDLDWDNDPWVRKTKRGIFKQVLLGSLYGRLCRSKTTLIAGNSYDIVGQSAA